MLSQLSESLRIVFKTQPDNAQQGLGSHCVLSKQAGQKSTRPRQLGQETHVARRSHASRRSVLHARAKEDHNRQHSTDDNG